MSKSTTGLVDHLHTFTTSPLHAQQIGLRLAYLPMVQTTFGWPVSPSLHHPCDMGFPPFQKGFTQPPHVRSCSTSHGTNGHVWFPLRMNWSGQWTCMTHEIRMENATAWTMQWDEENCTSIKQQLAKAGTLVQLMRTIIRVHMRWQQGNEDIVWACQCK